MSRLFTIPGTAIGAVVRWVILPVSGIVPFLVRTGLLFAGFAALWVVLIAAMFLEPGALDAAWAWLTGLPLLAQGLAWLLFLPLTGALWTWSFDWPVIVRVVVVLGIAGWNLFTFMPRRGTPAAPAISAPEA
jgi:hypothetical protein